MPGPPIVRERGGGWLICEDGISCPFAPHTFRRPNGRPSCGPKGEGRGRPADGDIYIQLEPPRRRGLPTRRLVHQ